MKKEEDIKVEQLDDNIRKHKDEKDMHVMMQARENNPIMKYYINCGFNILLYGVGSKRWFLNNFALQCLANDGPVLIVNGF